MTTGTLCIAGAPEAEHGRSANGGSCPNFEPAPIADWPSDLRAFFFFLDRPPPA